MNKIRRDLSLAPIKTAMDVYGAARRILVLTYKAFDFPARSYPPNVRFVGAQLEENAGSKRVFIDEWYQDREKPLIVATFSTNFAKQQEQLARTVIRALASLPVQCLLTVPVLDPTTLTGVPNVTIRQFVPHEDVFPHAQLVITHGGHGTVIKALTYGIPLICLPCDHDQFDVAARVMATGAGIRVPHRVSASALSESVSYVLGNESFKKAAAHMAATFQGEKSYAIIEELEELRNSSH